ncbi:hypothetical protein NEFER03_0229 [Nematocida sp. LUAm3]|nr:hypothetical protein NEFER03_0229 [Nematocida sp. LUAm3]KAI5173682.1 hypothetical protein NEFER02_0198 [Nematocida sp. LUAm2]KAI5176903.1 hypothetical protein NEFER01_0228 [Nematocida sp. LUAm1]
MENILQMKRYLIVIFFITSIFCSSIPTENVTNSSSTVEALESKQDQLEEKENIKSHDVDIENTISKKYVTPCYSEDSSSDVNTIIVAAIVHNQPENNIPTISSGNSQSIAKDATTKDATALDSNGSTAKNAATNTETDINAADVTATSDRITANELTTSEESIANNEYIDNEYALLYDSVANKVCSITYDAIDPVSRHTLDNTIDPASRHTLDNGRRSGSMHAIVGSSTHDTQSAITPTNSIQSTLTDSITVDNEYHEAYVDFYSSSVFIKNNTQKTSADQNNTGTSTPNFKLYPSPSYWLTTVESTSTNNVYEDKEQELLSHIPKTTKSWGFSVFSSKKKEPQKKQNTPPRDAISLCQITDISDADIYRIQIYYSITQSKLTIVQNHNVYKPIDNESKDSYVFCKDTLSKFSVVWIVMSLINPRELFSDIDYVFKDLFKNIPKTCHLVLEARKIPYRYTGIVLANKPKSTSIIETLYPYHCLKYFYPSTFVILDVPDDVFTNIKSLNNYLIKRTKNPSDAPKALYILFSRKFSQCCTTPEHTAQDPQAIKSAPAKKLITQYGFIQKLVHKDLMAYGVHSNMSSWSIDMKKFWIPSFSECFFKEVFFLENDPENISTAPKHDLALFSQRVCISLSIWKRINLLPINGNQKIYSGCSELLINLSSPSEMNMLSKEYEDKLISLLVFWKKSSTKYASITIESFVLRLPEMPTNLKDVHFVTMALFFMQFYSIESVFFTVDVYSSCDSDYLLIEKYNPLNIYNKIKYQSSMFQEHLLPFNNNTSMTDRALWEAVKKLMDKDLDVMENKSYLFKTAHERVFYWLSNDLLLTVPLCKQMQIRFYRKQNGGNVFPCYSPMLLKWCPYVFYVSNTETRPAFLLANGFDIHSSDKEEEPRKNPTKKHKHMLYPIIIFSLTPKYYSILGPCASLSEPPIPMPTAV